MRRRHPESALVGFIKRWRVTFAVVTLLAYVAAVPATIVVFPDNSLWLAMLILFTGITSTLVVLGDLLVNAEEAVRDDGDDPR